MIDLYGLGDPEAGNMAANVLTVIMDTTAGA